MVSPIGRDRLGEWVLRYRQSQESYQKVLFWIRTQSGKTGADVSNPPTRAQFAEWLTATTGISVTTAALGRLERGEGEFGPPVPILEAIVRSEILKIGDIPVDHSQLIGVLYERLDPSLPPPEVRETRFNLLERRIMSLSLSRLIKDELESQGYNPDSDEALYALIDAGEDLWEGYDRQLYLQEILQGQAYEIDSNALAAIAFTLWRLTGKSVYTADYLAEVQQQEEQVY